MVKAFWKFLAYDPHHRVVTSIASPTTFWQLEETKEIVGEPVLCRSGFHASETILDAARHNAGGVIARVTAADKIVYGDGKIASSKMWVDRAWFINSDTLIKMIREFADKLGIKHPANLFRNCVERSDQVAYGNADLSGSITNDQFIERLADRLQYTDRHRIIRDIALHPQGGEFLERFFLNNIICECSIDDFDDI